MKKFFSLALVASIVFSGCNSYLDVKPKGFTIPELVGDFEQLLNNTSLLRTLPASFDFLADNIQSGKRTDEALATSFDSYSFMLRSLYTFEHGPVLEGGDSDSYWDAAYNHIFTYNVVINNVLNAPDGKDAEKKRLWAEAKIGRAFEYLSLVNIYAKHYNEATATTDLGVPLILVEDINQKYERVSVAKIYELVQTDLEDALPFLATSSSNKFQPLKTVGFAFLSRVALYKGDYAAALSNAKEALKLNAYLEDYSQFTTKLKTTWGRVHYKGDPSKPFPEIRFNNETVWGRMGASSYGSLNGQVYASSDLLATYKRDMKGTKDMRYDLFFCRDSASFGGAVTHFPGRVLWGPYIDFNTGFSTPELYLIAAEAEARIGSTEEALKLLNTLRDKRIENNVHVSGLDKAATLAMVFDERRREMPYVGSTRLVDLKRLHTTGDLTKEIVHKVEDKEYRMSSGDPRMIIPISPKVLSLNPGMPQYER
ncbi:SusD family protein [Sphingobacterium nematocida]|uniref:SusD family protein n=1 Tax=Sphingobacterium nematocida TaxID=1513896 RepID=A0A1T5APE0_9SPHI|nr:RagB/SusD family nutrient uptake outer membrane protein [Sphingobacterium nematocida]SKB36745.1 SusD family protein [Sphingobacterium nematocida]